MPRGDGRLSHDLDPQRPGPQDACGVFGVWAPGEEVAKLTYFGLYALQHRGQEAAGIAVSDGSGVVVYKDLGLVAQVFDEPTLASLRGHLAIGHTRYSTTGGSTWENAQPTHPVHRRPAPPSRWPTTATWSTPPSWPREVAERGAGRRRLDQRHRPGDDAAGQPTRTSRSRPPRWRCCRSCAGAFSFVFMDEYDALRRPRPARRTPAGARPAGARLGGGQRDRRAGHRRRVRGPRGRARRADRDRRGRPALGPLRRAGAQGLPLRVRLPRPPGHHDLRPQRATPPGCEIGRRLAKEHPVEADLVIPVPESGTPAAIGYAEASGIPYGAGPGEERVRRAHLHPAVADDPPARHPAQAEPAARERPRQAARRGRRLDRARQHPARDRPDAARGRRAGGARAHLLAAGELAVLLRHRLRHPRRAAGQRAGQRRHPPVDRRRHARLRLARRADRRDRAAEDPAVPGLLRRRVPDRAAGRRT